MADCDKQKRYNETEKGKQTRKRWNSSNRRQLHIWFSNAKRRAREKNVPFELTKAYILSLAIPKACPVLGIPIYWQTQKKGMNMANSPSLDRVIPALGYVPGNVRIISHRANRLKADATVSELELVLSDLKNIPLT